MKKIIVVKIGSSILMTQRNKLDEFRIAHIADQVVSLKEEGFGVVLVVSGAVACGYKFIKFTDEDQELKQAAAGIGQSILTMSFSNIFSQKKMQIAQVLLTKENLNSLTLMEHTKDLLEFYIRSGFIAFINENDVLDLNSFGGNDYLAAEIATLINADKLIMLSTYDRSSYGVGGGQSKTTVINQMKDKSIQTHILNGKSKNTILEVVL